MAREIVTSENREEYNNKKMGYDSVAVNENGTRNLAFFRPEKHIKTD